MRAEHTDTVLFVTHMRYFGGAAVSLRILLGHLTQPTRRVLAAPNGVVADQLRSGGLSDEFVALPWVRGGSAREAAATSAAAARLVAWALRNRRRLAAVHANGLADAAVVAPAAGATRVPLVVWVHDTDPVSRRAARLIPMIRALARRVCWAAVSEASAVALSGRVDRADITVVPNPIEPEAIAARRTARSPTVRVGFLGTDTEVKGFDLLPDIVRGFEDDTRLVVFARRHEQVAAAVEKAWEELGQHSAVELAGRIDDVRSAYRQCDVVLCPSRDESFCRVGAEAMASGVPVVGSELPALRELVGDDAGLLFPVGDPGAAVEAVNRVAGDADLRRRLGESGRARARAFEARHVASRLEQLYFPSAP